jgi:signal transduction histidine kinase
VVVAYILLLFMFAKWGRKCLRLWKKAPLEPEVVCMMVYFGAALSLLFVASVFFYQMNNSDSLDAVESVYISLLLYFLMALFVVVTTLPGRIARMKLYNSSRMMEERQAFIRYISHEIRTPLNTVFLGMSFIKAEVSTLLEISPEQVEPVIDTIDDMSGSCQVALSILNDLLTFDKLESGKMAVELQDTHPWQFFRDTVKPFTVQTRQKGLTFALSVNGVLGLGDTR